MSRRRAPWAAALLPLVAMGSAWTAEPAAPQLSPEEVATLAARRAALAQLVEKALVDCAPPTGLSPADMKKAVAARAGVDETARLLRMADPNMADDLMRAGNQAILLMATLIDSFGNVRFVHIDREVATVVRNSPFDPITIANVRRFKYQPAMRGGQPVSSWKLFKVTFTSGADRMGNILKDDKLTEIVLKARDGDVPAQMAAAFLDSIAHQEVGIPEPEARHFLAVAAVNGETSALLRVTRMMGLPNCKPPAEVEGFLYRVAMAGKSDLELLHATRMLERGTVEGHPEVLPMLQGAANASDRFVQMWAAGILATAPIESVRDAQAALASAQSLNTKDDPDAGETLAAALAANGRYAEAVATEKAAIASAERWKWNTTNMRQRLAKYTAGEPWVGYLCDCDRLVPAGGL